MLTAQVDNALAIRLSIQSKTNAGFPATDRDVPDSEGNALSLRESLLRYTERLNDDRGQEHFDLRDRSMSEQDPDFVDINLKLSHKHNLQRIASNPVAAVEYYKVAFNAIVTTLFGVQRNDGKTELLPIHHDQRCCIFGRLTNFDANIEACQKGTLHFHAPASGVISPALLGALAHSPVLSETLADVFDSMISAALPPDRLLEHIVFEQYKTPLETPRPNFSSQIPANNFTDLEADSNTAAASTRTVMHFLHHCNACVKCGRACCRYAKPSGLVECTSMSMVALKPEFADHHDPRERHFDVCRPTERPQHNYARDPIEPLDARPLVFEMKRPAIRLTAPSGDQPSGAEYDIADCLDEPMFAGVDPAIKNKLRSLDKQQRETIKDLLFSANGLVSEFNHILMSVANCNMAVYPMGTAASAKAQFMYTVKYVCKNPAEIMSLLSILHDAALHVDKNPSTADDTGTEDRTTRHYLQRILNKLCGKQEYSGNQVVAALLGLPAEFQMHKTSQIYADAAARYVAEANNPRHETRSDSADPASSSDHDSNAHSESNDSEPQSGSDTSTAGDQRTAQQTQQHEIPLMALLPMNLTEEEEFGALSVPNDDESNSDEDEDNNGESEQAVREHEPGDAFTELMDQNQTHTGTVQITSFDDKGTPLISLQHNDYHWRPTECENYSLFEFGQTMRIIEKGKAKKSVQGKNPKNAGRKPAARFQFKEGHPLRSTHECQIMIQHMVPNIVKRIPRFPGPRPTPLTNAWKVTTSAPLCPSDYFSAALSIRDGLTLKTLKFTFAIRVTKPYKLHSISSRPHHYPHYTHT